MREEDSPFPTVNSNGRLECKGIWEGNRNRDTEITAGKVIGSIYSASCEGGKGGHLLLWSMQGRRNYPAGYRRCYRSWRDCFGNKPVRL